jgi:hypothetical protein
MEKFFLNREKLQQFVTDTDTLTDGELCQKYGISFYRDSIGTLPAHHFVCALKAHAAGKIHAEKFERVNEYGQPYPQVRGDGEKGQHTVHPITVSYYRVYVRTLDEQAKFLNEWLPAFALSERAFKLMKAQRLLAAGNRLLAEVAEKFDASQYTETHEEQPQVVTARLA